MMMMMSYVYTSLHYYFLDRVSYVAGPGSVTRVQQEPSADSMPLGYVLYTTYYS
jgi:hypothetical protein